MAMTSVKWREMGSQRWDFICHTYGFGFRNSDFGFWVLAGRAEPLPFFLLPRPVLVAPAFAADAPTGVTNIFKPLSTPAQAIHEVSLLVLAICAGIFLVVAGLLTLHCCCGFASGPEMKVMNRRKSTAAISSNSPGQ